MGNGSGQATKICIEPLPDCATGMRTRLRLFIWSSGIRDDWCRQLAAFCFLVPSGDAISRMPGFSADVSAERTRPAFWINWKSEPIFPFALNDAFEFVKKHASRSAEFGELHRKDVWNVPMDRVNWFLNAFVSA